MIFSSFLNLFFIFLALGRVGEGLGGSQGLVRDGCTLSQRFLHFFCFFYVFGSKSVRERGAQRAPQ